MSLFPLPLQIAGQIDNAIFEARAANGLVYYWLDHPYFDALIAQQGAHLISFKPKHQADWLWCSPQSQFEQGTAIRGGIPICWPCFGPAGSGSPLPKHGFARTTNWQLTDSVTTEHRCHVTLELDKHALLPVGISLRMRFEFSADKLKLSLETTNQSKQNFNFSGALHSYFAADVRKLQLTGLGSEYYDALSQRHRQQGKELVLDPETDRIYQHGNDINSFDSGLGHRLQVKHQGHNSIVIWNPGKALAASMADIGKDNASHFLCLETAITQTPMSLADGQRHQLTQEIRNL